MDEEWRALSRGSEQELRRCVLKAPVSFLVELELRLKAEADFAARRVAILQHMAPRCACGKLWEGKCDECVAAKARADELMRYWKEHGAYDRWLAGSQELVKDARNFVYAYWEAYFLTQEQCRFPGCDETYYCRNHIHWLPGLDSRMNRSKGRG